MHSIVNCLFNCLGNYLDILSEENWVLGFFIFDIDNVNFDFIINNFERIITVEKLFSYSNSYFLLYNIPVLIVVLDIRVSFLVFALDIQQYDPVIVHLCFSQYKNIS